MELKNKKYVVRDEDNKIQLTIYLRSELDRYAKRTDERITRAEELPLRSKEPDDGNQPPYYNNCTLKEKVLLHLLEHFDDGKSTPHLFSRYGMASAFDVAASQISRVTRKLLRNELIEKRRGYVNETKKFRNFYYLTTDGIYVANDIKDRLGHKEDVIFS